MDSRSAGQSDGSTQLRQLSELLHEAAERITACSPSSTEAIQTGQRGTRIGWLTFRTSAIFWAPNPSG